MTTSHPHSPPPQTLPTLNARDIVGPDGRAAIWLDETLYFLRITRSGKLILTK